MTGLDSRLGALLPPDVAGADGAVPRALSDALAAQPRVYDLLPRLVRTDQSNNYRPRTLAADELDAGERAALDACHDAMAAAAAALTTDELLAGTRFFFEARLSALSGAVVCETFRRLRALETPDAVRAVLGMPERHAFENAELERMTNTSAGEVLDVDALNRALLRENECAATDARPLRAALDAYAPRGAPHERFTVAVLRAAQDAGVDTRALAAAAGQ